MPHGNCKHLLGDLSLYLDGEASAEFCTELETHLANCEDCRVVVETLRATVRLAHTQPQPTLSPEARARLYAALGLSTP